jgi:hypothetical protein
MKILTVFAIVIILWSLGELILSLYAIWQSSKISHVIRIERTQRGFAEARAMLMELAIDNKIDPRSMTFAFLYHVNTMFMRRPDKYSELGNNLKYYLSSPDVSGAAVLRSERESWTEDVRMVMKATADAMDNVLWGYSLRWRVFVYIARHPKVRKAVDSFLRGLSGTILAKQEKKDPPVSDIRNAQKFIYGMAML